MRQVFTSVQPRADLVPPHARAGQAGYVCAVPVDPDLVGVKWDTDGAESVEKVADLKQLG